MSVEKDFLNIINEATKKGTNPYDAVATVVRTDASLAWVHIPGGVQETPADMTVSCKAGDSVRVRVSGGRCFVTGNLTAPPTDDTKAETAAVMAEVADATATDAKDTAEVAHVVATDAKAVAGKTAAMVREYQDGVLVCRQGQTVGALVNADGSFDVVGVTWSDGVPSASGSVASFGASAVIGNTESSALAINNNGLETYANGAKRMTITADTTSGWGRVKLDKGLSFTGKGGTLNNQAVIKVGGSIQCKALVTNLYNTLIVAETKVKDNVSIGASSNTSSTFSISKSGYTPIGIIGYRIENATSSGARANSCVASVMDIGGSADAPTCYYQIRNTATSAAKVKITARVLYIYNDTTVYPT